MILKQKLKCFFGMHEPGEKSQYYLKEQSGRPELVTDTKCRHCETCFSVYGEPIPLGEELQEDLPCVEWSSNPLSLAMLNET